MVDKDNFDIEDDKDNNALMEKTHDSGEQFNMKIENILSFGESSVFVVEHPASEHKRAEVIEAKKRELKNQKDYETFKEVDKEEDMKTIVTR